MDYVNGNKKTTNNYPDNYPFHDITLHAMKIFMLFTHFRSSPPEFSL